MNINTIKFAFLTISGLLFFAAALNKLYNMFFSKEYDKISKGRIDGIEIKTKRVGEKYCIIDIIFKTENGTYIKIKVEDTIYPSIYKVGDSVKVKYKSKEPSSFIIQETSQAFIYIIFAVVGIGIFVFGIFKLIYNEI